MGLGKTVITLTAIARLMTYGEITKTLIAAPLKVAQATWTAEAAKWAHLAGLRVKTCLGDAKSREALLTSDTWDVAVISRELLEWVDSRGGKYPFDCLVIDELTALKSQRSRRHKAARRIAWEMGYVIGLTGTPIPNGHFDLYGQVTALDHGKHFGYSVMRFQSEYFHTIEKNHIVIKRWLKDGAAEAIMDKLSDCALTMRAEDYLELPEMTVKDVEVTLKDVTLAYYRRFERDKIMELSGSEVTAQSAATLANKLSQYANGQVYDDKRGVVETHEEKLKALEELIMDDEHPLLVFYQYQHDRDRICKYLERFSPRVYNGVAELEDWNAGKIRLLLAHPASTAYGLNMQAGGHRIVWYSTGWNLELYAQANARLHRQGQREMVTVMRLIAKGTIDERMAAAIDSKGESQTAFLDEMKKKIKDYGTK